MYNLYCPWRHDLAVSSTPSTEEIGAMGREIEYHRGTQGGSYKNYYLVA
jgi:hypothetical protein